MNVVERMTKLSRELPQEKQIEVLDFVEFLMARQARKLWTVDERQKIVATTMGCLAGTRTSSDAFAERKKEVQAKEERRCNP
jgi:hypothetical protein